MHLTRLGYNVVVAIWLLPMALIDFIGNTITTGHESEMYYYKFMVDGLLVAYAIWQCFRPATSNIETAGRRVRAQDDEVVSFEKLGAVEYIYCALLFLYALGCWYTLHTINVNSTGAISMGSLIWSFLSIAVAVLSAVQFYHLKSGAIVELKHKVLQ